jgi:hypothetical protein
MIVAPRQLTNGKWFALITLGYAHDFKIVHTTAEYYTKEMAIADGECWVAFHGTETKMTEAEEKNLVREEHTYRIHAHVWSPKDGHSDRRFIVKGVSIADAVKKLEDKLTASHPGTLVTAKRYEVIQ